MKIAQLFVASVLVAAASRSLTAGELANEWRAESPRAEIRPEFRVEKSGGPNDGERLIVEHDGREGLDGWWTKAFPVSGGRMYRFSCLRRAHQVSSPRRSAVVRVLWRNNANEPVIEDRPLVSNYLGGWTPRAEPDYPGPAGDRDRMGHGCCLRGRPCFADVLDEPWRLQRGAPPAPPAVGNLAMSSREWRNLQVDGPATALPTLFSE
jgi:hypothetical protein